MKFSWLLLFFFMHQISFASVDEKVRNIPASLERQVKNNPNEHLPKLVEYLTKNRSEYDQIKAIHDWIATRIDYDANALFGRSKRVVEPYAVIKYGKSVCDGYSSLFKLMCDISGIEAIKVNGYARGYGIDAFSEENKEFFSNHSWNVVKYKNQWQIIDCTWDAGYLQNGKFVERYSTSYFMSDPKKIIHTHFPESNEWQLLEKPISFQEFKNLVHIYPLFISNNIEFVEPLRSKVTTNGELEFTLKAGENLDISANVFQTNGQGVSNQTIVQKLDDGTHRIIARFPKTGKFILHTYARDKNGNTDNFEGIISLGIENKSASKNAFPEMFGIYFDLNASIIAPTESPLVKNKEYTFQLSIDTNDEVGVLINRQAFPMTKVGENMYETQLKVEGNEAFIYKRSGNQYEFLLRYIVSSR